MSAYDVLGRYYDLLMQEVDYEARADYLLTVMERHGVKPGTVLDLACGTGCLSAALARRGCEVVGVDASEQMLALAAEKAEGLPKGRLLFLWQEMGELDLYGTVNAAVCTLDGINHLLTEEDVRQAFERVSLFLEPGGVFVFDVNTPYKFANILGNNTFVYDYDEIYCVWQNAFDRESGVCEFLLTFFEPEGALYRRQEEVFAERAYADDRLRTLLSDAGMTPLACYADLSFDAPGKTEQRAVYVARKD
ncbi:MAG: class I SAM-dependent methyltransferase [Ethanoligenens sp.]